MSFSIAAPSFDARARFKRWPSRTRSVINVEFKSAAIVRQLIVSERVKGDQQKAQFDLGSRHRTKSAIFTRCEEGVEGVFEGLYARNSQPHHLGNFA